MRFFSIIAAVLVLAALYVVILERPWLMQTIGASAAEPAPEPAKMSETAPDTALKRVKVVVQRSTAQEIKSGVVLRGQTSAAREVDVRAETSSTVVSEPLRKGAYVEQGAVLCSLDLGTRGAELAEATAGLNEAQSRVPESLARVEEMRARLEEAEINQNASARLKEDGFASTTRVASSDAAVAAAKAGISSAQAGLRAARSGIESAQAAIAKTEKEIERLTVKAPFAGLLESDTAELGSLLQPGGLCATVIQLDPIKLVGFLPETEVNRVSVGAFAGARLAAGGDDLRGKVTFLSRSADPSTRTFRVEIDVPNPDMAIRDGQTVEILISSEGATAHLVPQSALTLNDEGTLGLRVVDAANKVAFVPVSLVRDTSQGVWVTGLSDVADVIVVGQEYVIAGVTVEPTLREDTQ